MLVCRVFFNEVSLQSEFEENTCTVTGAKREKRARENHDLALLLIGLQSGATIFKRSQSVITKNQSKYSVAFDRSKTT